MSVATRLQSLQQSIEASTQPTDVGVAGPTPGIARTDIGASRAASSPGGTTTDPSGLTRSE